MKLKNNISKISLIATLISLLLFFSVKIFYIGNMQKNYTEFLQDLNSKKITAVYLDDASTIRVKLINGQIYETDNPRKQNFKAELLNKNIKVYENSFMSIPELIPAVALFLSASTFIFVSIKNSKLKSRGSFSFSSLNVEAIENCSYNFSIVAGNDEAKHSVEDMVDFLKNPDKYNAYGARMPKGIIFYGEPGTGKTLLAKAIAGEANVPFYAVSGSDFVQMYVGVGAGRIRDLFKKAKKHGKAVIFIDEIDAIGKKRDNGSGSGSSDEKDQTLNALLTEMSGFNEKEGIIVIAATNRLDMLDPALLRPGRFDRHIEVTLPDLIAREKIIELYLKNKPTKNIDVKQWAKKTSYFSGAKLESLINEAAIIACKENKSHIDNSVLDKAYSIVLTGHEKFNRDYIKDEDKEITAVHESGHALINSLIMPEEKVSKVTIIPSTKGAGGYTLSIPEDRLFRNKSYLENRIMILLAGRAAEEIYFGEKNITTGAYNDMQKTTDLVFNMISRYGMGTSLGLLNIDELKKHGINNPSMVLDECKTTIENLYEETKKLILENKSILDIMKDTLLQKETLYENDIASILNTKVS